MPITVNWEDDSKTILRYEVAGKYTADDIYRAHYKGAEMGGVQPHRVDVIIDMRYSQGMPVGVISHFGKLAELQTDNTGLCVVISENRVVHTMFKVSSKAFSKIEDFFIVAQDNESAHALIEQARAKATP